MNSFVIFGLPAHILLVHAVVVLMPLTAIAVLLHALWPAARRRLGFVTPLAALVVLVLVPITVSAGEALEAKVGVTPAVQKHADLGQTLLPWAIALFVIALVEWGWYRFAVGMRVPASVGASARVPVGVSAGSGSPSRSSGAGASLAEPARSSGETGAAAAPVAERIPQSARVASAIIIAVAAVVIAGGAVINIVLIGDAGARAVWGGIVGG